MDNRFLYGVGALVAVCAGIKLTSKESFDAESFEAEDAFKGMRKGSTKIIEGFDVKKTDKYSYRITDETLKDGSFVVLMYETQIIPYEKRNMEGWNWKEGWTFSEASFRGGVLGKGYYNTQNPPRMKKWDRSMSYGFNTQMEALKFLKKAYDNGDFEDGHLIFDAETFGVEFNEWAEQEMLTHGKNISFKDWAEDEGLKHGDVPITDWAEHEEESHDERYEADESEQTSFDVINIEYIEDGEETFDYPEQMLISVETRENDHYTYTKDRIRANIKSYIRRNFGNDVEVVDFLAFPVGSNIELGQEFEAEGDYEPRFYSLGERIGWMEFAVADENWRMYEEDYIDVVLDIEEWNENNANNSKLSNLVKQYKDRSSFRPYYSAETFEAFKYGENNKYWKMNKNAYLKKNRYINRYEEEDWEKIFKNGIAPQNDEEMVEWITNRQLTDDNLKSGMSRANTLSRINAVLSSYFDERMYFRPYGAETFGADEEEDWEYHVYVGDSKYGDMFIVDNARDFGTKEEAIKAAHDVSKDERGKGKEVYVIAELREYDEDGDWIDSYEESIYTIGEDGDVLRAETFEADTVLNQESFDKLMGQLDRMTYNELYMIRHQAQLRLRELGNRL
tara:strand:+ start:325 stop:2184 length:1860 start_codon:yes stop_codon:yes gene_type:complete